MSGRELPIVLMNVSGIYRQQRFWEEEPVSWVDLEGLSGTNCYCDEAAAGKILQAIQDYPLRGIHFLDSGNYHYLSRLWMEKAQEPFQLLVFDNHTDMQPPAFGGLLSCGGWVLEALTELPFLRHVFLVGPSETDCRQVMDSAGGRMTFLCREELSDMRSFGRLSRQGMQEKGSSFWEKIPSDLPLYLSVDKDILDRESGRMAWSQGDMETEELSALLESLGDFLHRRGIPLLTADVCGEQDCHDVWDEGNALNDRANRILLDVLKGIYI